MRCLITGIGGFAGFHLAACLRERGDEVFGTYWPAQLWRPEDFTGIPARAVDINDSGAVRAGFDDFAPEAVFHLAAVSNVKIAWESKKETLQTNFIGTFNVLEAAATSASPPKVLLVGSAEEYGPVPVERQPITEQTPLDPRNPYAVSKVAQEYLGRQYLHCHGLRVHMVRAFNHIGPRQAPTFVASSFARQIAEIECGRRENAIRVGNLESRRDFTDVRDTVRAYAAVVDHGRPGDVYNVCSGNPIRIGDILDALLAEAKTSVRVETDPQRYRPSDVPLFQGDASKILRDCDWEPRIRIRETLRDLLDYWRAEARAGR